MAHLPSRADHVGSLLRPAALKEARVQHTAGTLSNVHHAFEAEDYDAAVQALHGKNIPIERTGVCKDGQRYLFICDPNGNRGNCAHQQGCSTVERQTLAPSLALAEREGSR